jgi:hypothetical protein
MPETKTKIETDTDQLTIETDTDQTKIETDTDKIELTLTRLKVVVVFITGTCTANGGHWVPPGGLQAYSLPQPWLCRAPKVRRGGEGDACVSMETCNIKIHNREHRFSNSVPISGP